MIAANAFRNSSFDHDCNTRSSVTSFEVRLFGFCVLICSAVFIIKVLFPIIVVHRPPEIGRSAESFQLSKVQKPISFNSFRACERFQLNTSRDGPLRSILSLSVIDSTHRVRVSPSQSDLRPIYQPLLRSFLVASLEVRHS